MPIPKFDEIVLPFLKITKENGDYNTERAIRYFAKTYNLTDEENELTFSDDSRVFRELIRMVRNHLMGAGLIEGFNNSFKVSKDGNVFLKTKPTTLILLALKKIPKHKPFWKNYEDFYTDKFTQLEEITENILQKTKATLLHSKLINSQRQLNLFKLSTEEEISRMCREHSQIIKDSLLERLKNLHSATFEELCVLVIKHLLYDNNEKIQLKDISKTLNRTGDGGIDGIVVKKDKIKESKYYIQAKCWKDTQIGRPELQKFAGALAGQKARDGIFITTSKFTSTAIEFVQNQTNYEIKLIDGEELVDMMIDVGIGIQKIATFELNAIDTEFFILNRPQVNISKKPHK